MRAKVDMKGKIDKKSGPKRPKKINKRRYLCFAGPAPGERPVC